MSPPDVYKRQHLERLQQQQLYLQRAGPLLRAAMEAKADVLLTSDKDFLESGMKNPAGITPAAFFGTNTAGRE